MLNKIKNFFDNTNPSSIFFDEKIYYLKRQRYVIEYLKTIVKNLQIKLKEYKISSDPFLNSLISDALNLTTDLNFKPYHTVYNKIKRCFEHADPKELNEDCSIVRKTLILEHAKIDMNHANDFLISKLQSYINDYEPEVLKEDKALFEIKQALDMAIKSSEKVDDLEDRLFILR